jgi:broad specificity phosphatase PhoE
MSATTPDRAPGGAAPDRTAGGAATLILARHGRTVWHAGNRYAGRTEVELDDVGRAQAAALAAWASTAGIAAVVSSPQLRARSTAEPAARALGVALDVDERLREIDFGGAEGLLLSDLGADVVAAYERDPVAHHLPGGEDPRAVAERCRAGLEAIAAAHRGARVLVVGHNAALRLALCALLGVPLRDYRRRFPVLDNGALSELRMDGHGAGLVRFNVPLAP